MSRLVFALLLGLCPTVRAQENSFEKVHLFVGPNVSPAIAHRMEILLSLAHPMVAAYADATATNKIPLIKSDKQLGQYLSNLIGKGRNLILSFGQTPITDWILKSEQLADLKPESFVIAQKRLATGLVIAANGNGFDPKYIPEHQKKLQGSIGAHFAAYAVLEKLGFGFLHPLKPIIPKTLSWTQPQTIKESPRWPHRTIHLHTMHPIELTDVLNGWGPDGFRDKAAWEKQLPLWINYMDWLLANRQNQVQWVLLEKDHWLEFSQSSDRQDRLQKLVNIVHQAGIFAGIDVPIALEQQNSFRLIWKSGSAASESSQMHRRIDWLMAAGFDYISTEMGFSEFTAPLGKKMLDWLNDFSQYMENRWKSFGESKAHVSTGQRVKGYSDPATGAADVNFNFLSYYAHKNLGILVHTVQHYGLDDPAPTYGRNDFHEMFQYMKAEAGRRKVIWYPETAYWVSFDVDVPLFLPVYAQRRFHDLRLIAHAESAGDMKPIQGQTIFSSGWEWGYWLNDVVAARAAWNPIESVEKLDVAFQELLENVFAPLGPHKVEIAKKLVEISRFQHETLIQKNGQGYLQGWDTWDDLPQFLNQFPFLGNLLTQPDRMAPAALTRKDLTKASYTQSLEPLLKSMEDRYLEFSNHWKSFSALKDHPGYEIILEIQDALQLTHLRSRQVRSLYEYAAQTSPLLGPMLLARSTSDEALELVKSREKYYRMNADQIAGWNAGPTSYSFRYLWTVRKLFYWYRDEGIFAGRARNFCYLNTIDPAIVVSPEGRDDWRFQLARLVAPLFTPFLGSIDQCVNPSSLEPDARAVVRN